MRIGRTIIVTVLIGLSCTLSLSAVLGLQAKVTTIPGISKDSTPSAISQRTEMVNKVSEVLETMLYSQSGKEQAYQEGRRIFKDYVHGTITVVDTKQNQEKVADYISQLQNIVNEYSGVAYTKPKSKLITIHHADSNNLRNLINQVIQESHAGRTTNGGTGNVGDYLTGVITLGAGNGLTFYNTTVELIQLSGDTTNPQAKLYIYTPARDREVTLSKGNSELVDAYRIRLISADLDRQEAEVEIRVANSSALR